MFSYIQIDQQIKEKNIPSILVDVFSVKLH
jgi:hypothetical protein